MKVLPSGEYIHKRLQIKRVSVRCSWITRSPIHKVPQKIQKYLLADPLLNRQGPVGFEHLVLLRPSFFGIPK